MASEWTVMTTPPTVAERWARRTLHGGPEGVVPPKMWPHFWASAFLVASGFGAFLRAEWVWLTVCGMTLMSAVLMSWQRSGFRLLIERYEAELGHLREVARKGARVDCGENCQM